MTRLSLITSAVIESCIFAIVEPRSMPSSRESAVAVYIEGSLVGHIARDDTPLFHAAFKTVADAGYRGDGFMCLANIGWSGIPTDSPIGVRLDLNFHDE